MPWPTCDVCGGEATSVTSSAAGALSLAYCVRCAESGAEPFGLLAGSLGASGITSREKAGEWLHESIEATCQQAGKTEAEFWAEARRIDDMIMNDPELHAAVVAADALVEVTVDPGDKEK